MSSQPSSCKIAPRIGSLTLAAVTAASCYIPDPAVRIPLPVPLPAVAGATPTVPQGLELIGDLGDGVWGQ